MKKPFGQYMTPNHVCTLLANKIDGDFDELIDLAAGDCSLLSNFANKFKKAEVFGFDIDSALLKLGGKKLSNETLTVADGLSVELEPLKGRKLVVANPPYGEYIKPDNTEDFYEKVFHGIGTNMGKKRLEVQFLSKCLHLIKQKGGVLVIIMPVSFCDGERFRPHRKRIMESFNLERCIEFPPCTFSYTEARTVALVINSVFIEDAITSISTYNNDTHLEESIFSGVVVSGERLDGKFYKSQKWNNLKKLNDLGVSIFRGKHSNKAAKELKLNAIHTSDLSKPRGKYLNIPPSKMNSEYMKRKKDIFAEPGDILLSRTGKRVSWQPLIVAEGKAPITDHVFRIRAPKESINLVIKSFDDPNFSVWLESVSKGVCASVLTKYDLLRMPIFASY